MPLNSRTLLLGLGNDLLSDDAIGWRVAREVGELLAQPERVAVVVSAEMGLALLDEITGFDKLVIVDAVETGQAPPGFVHELEGADLSAVPAISPHFLGIGEMLALGRKMGLPVPQQVKIFAIEVQDALTVSTQMSPALEAALPEILQLVKQGVALFISERS